MDMWNNAGQIYHTASSKYLYVWQFRTFYYCFNDCCNLIVPAYTTISAPVLWAWIFLSCTKCCSYIFRMVSLTFSECKITTSGLHPNAILSIVYVLNGISTNFITYIIMSAAEIYFFPQFSFCHLSQIHMNKDGALTKTALVCIKSS